MATAAATAAPVQQTWVVRLKDHCAARHFPEPTYQDISDRRGGRTAWSCIVTIGSGHYQARYWYDGAYTATAKQDSAEVGLRTLTGTLNTNVDPPPASYYAALYAQQAQQRLAAASS